MQTACEWHFLPTAQRCIAHGRPVAEQQPQLCGVFWPLQLESGEGWLSGERHTGPSLMSRCVALCIAGSPNDRLWALAVNICSRDCTICPRARGKQLFPSQTSCGAPDVDLSSPGEAENMAKTQSEPLSAETRLTCLLCFVCRVWSQWGLGLRFRFFKFKIRAPIDSCFTV